jgi:chromate transporter
MPCGEWPARAPDRERATVVILSTIVVLAWPGAPGQVLVIAVAGLVGWRLLTGPAGEKRVSLPPTIGRRTAVASLVVFFALLVALPLLRPVVTSRAVIVFDSFFRVGSLVFGGGHVVLPLLQAEVVPPGWVTNEEFVAGYGAAQAVPGPLFTFAAYLGASMHRRPNGIAGTAIALVAIFLPTFLMVVGVCSGGFSFSKRPGNTGQLPDSEGSARGERWRKVAGSLVRPGGIEPPTFRFEA